MAHHDFSLIFAFANDLASSFNIRVCLSGLKLIVYYHPDIQPRQFMAPRAFVLVDTHQ
jgi:hypothetical protein